MEKSKNSNQCMDGGVINKSNCDKTRSKIEDSKIIKLNCVFSLLAMPESSLLGNRVYSLDAVLESGIVKGRLNWYCCGEGEKYTFESEPSFMDKLQEIVAKYDLAKHNGYTYIVNGLPDMYGAKIDIRYESGEYIYAHNNEECFLPMEMMEETVKLFRKVCEK